MQTQINVNSNEHLFTASLLKMRMKKTQQSSEDTGEVGDGTEGQYHADGFNHTIMKSK
jgi:hypothetical protein